MGLKEQIEEAERMQRWGYADLLRAKLDEPLEELLPEIAHPEPIDAHDLEEPDPDNAEPEGADVTPDAPASNPEE